MHSLIRLWSREKRLLSRSLKQITRQRRNYFVAVDTDTKEIVGCVALEVFSSKLAEIRSLAVNPKNKGSGIGTALVAACIKRAKSRRIAEVMAITSSEGFFQRHGFDFALPGEKKALFYWTR